jgi:hypothetical protein
LDQAISEQQAAMLRIMEEKLNNARQQLADSHYTLAHLSVGDGIQLAAASERVRDVEASLQNSLAGGLLMAPAVLAAASHASTALSGAYLTEGRVHDRQSGPESAAARLSRQSHESAEYALDRLKAAHRALEQEAEAAFHKESQSIALCKLTGEISPGLLGSDPQVFAEMQGLAHLDALRRQHLAEIEPSALAL